MSKQTKKAEAEARSERIKSGKMTEDDLVFYIGKGSAGADVISAAVRSFGDRLTGLSVNSTRQEYRSHFAQLTFLDTHDTATFIVTKHDGTEEVMSLWSTSNIALLNIMHEILTQASFRRKVPQCIQKVTFGNEQPCAQAEVSAASKIEKKYDKFLDSARALINEGRELGASITFVGGEMPSMRVNSVKFTNQAKGKQLLAAYKDGRRKPRKKKD